MSWDGMAWAKAMKVGRSADKLILIALGDRHNEDSGVAFPSIQWLCDFSDLDRKTVIAALSRLEVAGFIADTGQRVGRTAQIKAYSLNFERVPNKEQFQNRNGSGFSFKQSQKRDTEPVRDKEAKASTNRRAGFVIPDDIPAEPFASFVEMRRKIGKGMTEKAKLLAVEKLRKLRDEDGWPPGEVLNHCTLNSYQGLYPPKKDYRHDRQTDTGLGRTASAAIGAFGDPSTWDQQTF